MDALKSSFRPDAVAQRQSHGSSSEETAWVVVEKGENFSVDELFNLGEFGNNEQEAEEDEEYVKKAEAAKRTETENNSCVAVTASSLPSSSGSAVSFDAPPSLPMPLSLSEMSLPAHVAEELEWVSFIIDDSASEFPAGVAPFNMLPQAQSKSHDSAQHETPRQQSHAAAVAATQGASFPCSTVHALSTQAPVPARAKRSKRSRTVPVCWSSLRFTDSCSTTTTSMTTSSASSCSSASSSLSCLIYDHPVTTNDQNFLLHVSHPSPPLPPPPQSKGQKVPKKRGRRPKPHADGGASRPSGERRCSHCGVQKTPQWRAGPLGAKTLCNACGVRFKSGRLLPEYRPACSPTFQNSIHSNSHRKVLEMRRKKEILAAAGPPIAIC